jgi:hypothetical protein
MITRSGQVAAHSPSTTIPNLTPLRQASFTMFCSCTCYIIAWRSFGTEPTSSDSWRPIVAGQGAIRDLLAFGGESGIFGPRSREMPPAAPNTLRQPRKLDPRLSVGWDLHIDLQSISNDLPCALHLAIRRQEGRAGRSDRSTRSRSYVYLLPSGGCR